MENIVPQSWIAGYSNYLAPLGNMLVEPFDALKHSVADTGKATKRTQNDAYAKENRRPALGDISNNVIQQSRVADGKVTKQNANAARPPLGHSSSSQHHPGDSSMVDSTHLDKKRRDWVDVDRMNKDDPQQCSEYAQSIFEHMREAELVRRPNPRYLEDVQPDINPKMRAILVDWLVEVAEEYKLCADTLYQTVNYIDRFLSLHVVQRNQLQLVGVGCMWIAAKYEEIYPPNVADFCYITDNTYTREQVLHMEETVLKTLGYELTVPTAKMFLRRLLQVCNPDELLHFLSNYLTEIALLDHNMMNYLPSEIAASAVYLANLILKRQPWDGTLQHYGMYEPRDFAQCVQALVILHQAVSTNPQLSAIRDKYGHARFQSVSRFPCLTSLPHIA